MAVWPRREVWTSRRGSASIDLTFDWAVSDCRGVGATLEVRTHPDVPERPVETEGAAGARIALTIRFAAGLGIDGGGFGVGDGVGEGVEDIASPDGRSEVLEHLVRQIQVRGPLGGEELAGIVVLVPVRTVPILVYRRPNRAEDIAQIQVDAAVRGIVFYVVDSRLSDDRLVVFRDVADVVVEGKSRFQAA